LKLHRVALQNCRSSVYFGLSLGSCRVGEDDFIQMLDESILDEGCTTYVVNCANHIVAKRL